MYGWMGGWMDKGVGGSIDRGMKGSVREWMDGYESGSRYL